VVEGVSGRQSTVVAADLAVTLGHPELGVPLKCVTATARLSTMTKLTQQTREGRSALTARDTPLRFVLFFLGARRRKDMGCVVYSDI